MPRGADRLLSKITGSSIESAPAEGQWPVRKQLPSAVYVYRHPMPGNSIDDSWSLSLTRELEQTTGNRLRPVGSIIRRSPNTMRDKTRRARTLQPTSNPPSPPLDPTTLLEEPVPAVPKSPVPPPIISVGDSPPSQSQSPERQVSFNMDGKSTTLDADELMQILMEDDGTDRPVLFTIFEAANIDGVKHLSSKNRCTRYTWFLLIILFICLCFYQIGAQAIMYWMTPVATNIMAVYPETIPFPVVAICNNNQHRLSWLSGPFVQNRHPNTQSPTAFRQRLNQSDVFDKVMLNSWDMDAGSFLTNAAHQRAQMIVRCVLPNGSRCSHKDFRPLWTLTGLCWAINTDPDNPLHATGAGPGNALRLLVNVERYERVESCTPKLRTRSLPGLKVLVYNQTDVPTHYLEGVNIPAGFTMDIPFWMRHRQKLPGRDCVVFDSNKSTGGGSGSGKEQMPNETTVEGGEEGEDLRNCLIRSYLGQIERRCNCSMRSAYLQKSEANGKFPPCNVLQYFECVQPVLEWALNKGFVNFRGCPIPCENIDYTAWQDMTELPANIFPRLISEGQEEEDDEDDSEEEDSSEEQGNRANGMHQGEEDDAENAGEREKQEHYHCTHNQLLTQQHIRRIKKAAQLAFEKQAQFQEDIQLRTRRLVAQMRQTANRIVEMRWGWKNKHFLGVYQRLKQMTNCYDEIPNRHPDVFNAMANLKGEEERAEQLLLLINPLFANSSAAKGIKTIGDVQKVFGERTEEKRKEMAMIEEMVRLLHSLFAEETFADSLPRSLERMDKVLQLIDQFESGHISRKSWAERMRGRNMRHFFDEDFYESWYNLVVKDLEISVLKSIQEVEDLLPTLHRNSANGTALMTGSVILFGQTGGSHVGLWAAFLDDALECIFNEIRNASAQMLKEFQRAMYDLHSAQSALFEKELPEYLENFDFGPKFVKENFAQVNVFLHKMNVEFWRQEPTYSIWSFFCDIGATMSLFLGASMLTIIEVLYFLVQNTRLYKSITIWKRTKLSTTEQKNNQRTKDENIFRKIGPECV